MSLFAGLDISVKTTAICVVDANGRVFSRRRSIAHQKRSQNGCASLISRSSAIGLEAGPLSQWIYAGLVDIGPCSDLCRDPAHACSPFGADQQDRPERRPRDRPDDARRTIQGRARQRPPPANIDASC